MESWEDGYHTMNAFNFEPVPVMTADKKETVQTFDWGLIPAWCKDAQQANELKKVTLNAKSETVFEKPSFRNSISGKRCLIFIKGFYEWKEIQKKKYPYYIHLKEQSVFTMGGIYDSWLNTNTGKTVHSCSIITTEANPLMAEIHNTKKRMPLIFDKTQADHWLKSDLSKEEITELMQPFDENKMEAYTISKLISSRTENANVAAVKNKFMYAELSPGLF
ncbi:MAG: hypothetical protein JWP12_1169 [Bacteroidetes bacterium]|nr:hypothetical protein [Bacteroidota bacterium]